MKTMIEKPKPFDKFTPENDPLGLERFVVVEIQHDLVSSLTGYYHVVARWIKDTDPEKAAEFRKRAKEVFSGEREGTRKSFPEREIIVEKLSKEFKQLLAFAKEWKIKNKIAQGDAFRSI